MTQRSKYSEKFRTTCSVPLPGGTAAGDIFLGAIADSANVVAESFEDNNTGYDRVTVMAP